VLVSSHVLHEVEALTQNIILLNRGRLVAAGNIRQIRELIDQHPHHIKLVSDNHRELASEVITWDDVVGLTVLNAESAIVVETHSPDAFYGRLPGFAVNRGLSIRAIYSDDDNLEAVFKYLVSK
jgi:ABC-2 type transport system ATP-binding protein